MDNTKQLKELESITGLTEKEMNDIIIKHYETFGLNLAVKIWSQIFILEDYYNQIVAEYDKYNAEVIEMNWLQENKSQRIAFQNGFYVYFLFDNETLVYIGQTVNLAKRIGTHIDSNKVFDSIAFIETRQDNNLLIESINIRHYKPKFNISIIPDDMIFKNILKTLYS